MISRNKRGSNLGGVFFTATVTTSWSLDGEDKHCLLSFATYYKTGDSRQKDEDFQNYPSSVQVCVCMCKLVIGCWPVAITQSSKHVVTWSVGPSTPTIKSIVSVGRWNSQSGCTGIFTVEWLKSKVWTHVIWDTCSGFLTKRIPIVFLPTAEPLTHKSFWISR